MKNLKKVLTMILVAGLIALGLVGITKGVDAFASKAGWGYIEAPVNTI